MSKITINTQSITNQLRAFIEKPQNSFLEYIWNGFDANATTVNVSYSFSEYIGDTPIGYPFVEISDDGDGWDMDDLNSTRLFLVSPKKHSHFKSLPQGKDGVGRFTFFSFASKAIWETICDNKKHKLTLKSESLNDYTLEKSPSLLSLTKGTKVSFFVNTPQVNENFFKVDLPRAIKLEFAWFLKLYPNKKIFINGEPLDIKTVIRKEEQLSVVINEYNFDVLLVQWKEKPTRELSKYYFLGAGQLEAFKIPTGLNYKSDDFYHSAYISSSFFDNYVRRDYEKLSQTQIEFSGEKEQREIYHDLIKNVTERLEVMRKPFLYQVSELKISEWKRDKVLPTMHFGIKQEDFDALVKELYVVVPQLFTNSSNEQRKVILNLFSSLLSTEDKDLIIKILNQVYSLSEEDKKNLNKLLEKTTLSNIIRTVKEVDHRLEVINVLDDILLSNKRIYTKEVDHLQRVLDENFWIFGEGYRLFASTEGALRKTLIHFKDEILHRIETEVETKSRKELDIFLTKYEVNSDEQNSVIVEIKRPSIILGKKEYDQIREYMGTVLKEPSCNGDNIRWTFYLIGCDVDSYVQQQIDSYQHLGEKKKGLAFSLPQQQSKLYIKKWSDIIYVEQKSKYQFLQEKLKLELNQFDNEQVDNVINSVLAEKT